MNYRFMQFLIYLCCGATFLASLAASYYLIRCSLRGENVYLPNHQTVLEPWKSGALGIVMLSAWLWVGVKTVARWMKKH